MPHSHSASSGDALATRDVQIVSVRGVVRAAEGLLDTISRRLRVTAPETVAHEAVAPLRQQLARIEGLCEGNGIVPAEMPRPSRNAYALLAFLNSNGMLRRYVDSTASFRGAIASLVNSSAESYLVRLNDLGGLYRYRRRGLDWWFRLSPGFLAADEDVLTLVAKDLLRPKHGDRRRRLHEFVHGEAFLTIVQDIEELVAETVRTAGTTYDLDEICEHVRHRYFSPPVPRPTSLSWTDRLTYRTFGHYNVLRDRITISRSLDSPRVPRQVIEFIMFHELLHKVHGIGWAVSRKMMHGAAFRADERRFPHVDTIKRFLSRWSTVMREHSQKRARGEVTTRLPTIHMNSGSG